STEPSDVKLLLRPAGSVVIELFHERFQAGHIWLEVFLVVSPAAQGGSIKRLFCLGGGWRIDAFCARMLVKLQDTLFKFQPEKPEHGFRYGREVVDHLLIADIHPPVAEAREHRTPEIHD